MKLSRRRMNQWILSAAALPAVSAVALPARAEQGKEPEAGRDFLVLKPPQPVETGNRIAVLDFFQYSCPHCFHFLPELQAWKKRLPADVEYVYSPVVFNEQTTPHAKILYALDALKKLEDLHTKVFTTIQVQRRMLLDPNDIADFMASQGIDRAQWLATFNSFTVATKVNKAGQVWRAYQIDGTPTLGCDGKYTTSPAMVNSATGSLQVMDYLIDRSRKERAHKG